MLTVGLAKLLAKTSPGFFDCDLVDIADVHATRVVHRTGDDRSVLVDGHRVVSPWAGDAKIRVVDDGIRAHAASRRPFQHRTDFDLRSPRLPEASIALDLMG